ncbi:MAG: hypothetical protein AAF747_11990, partial [Planctomycetota bacterium]
MPVASSGSPRNHSSKQPPPDRMMSCGGIDCGSDPAGQRDRSPLFGLPNEQDRAQATAEAKSSAADAVDAGTPERGQEMDRIKAHLLCWLDAMAIGTEFQTIDFISYLADKDALPREELVDARVMGGLSMQLVRKQIVKTEGMRYNAGCKVTGTKASPRQVYKLISKDFNALGWFDRGAIADLLD